VTSHVLGHVTESRLSLADSASSLSVDMAVIRSSISSPDNLEALLFSLH
jgi:hypothetical protein